MADRTNGYTGSRTYNACCDIYHKDDKVILRMEMPGVEKENLDIRVDNDKLLINGKKSYPGTESTYLIREIRQADYHHEFSIDDTIDRNKIEASLTKGIATITLGIKESEKPKKITVEVK